MTSDWLNNPDAVANIKRLLGQTGAPLESRVARICANTDRWFQPTIFENLLVSRGRLVYGDTLTDTPLREVDQGIMVQSYVDIDEDGYVGVLSLQLHVLIECKHRDGLAIFGFPYESSSPHMATYPIVCEFAFAPFMQDLHRTVPILQQERICTIGLLDNMQKTPRVSDEQLIYKAGASLYDCLRFQSLPLIEPFLDPTIHQMGLIEHFKEAVKAPYLDAWQQARRWIRSHLTDELSNDFYTRRGDGMGFPAPSVAVFVPIVCVDAPLYMSEMNDQGTIESITPKDYLLSTLRIPKWPSVFHHYLAHSTPEALVTIVNVESLDTFLTQIAVWFGELGEYMQSIEAATLRKVFVEQYLLQSLLSTVEQHGPYEDMWRI